MKITFLGTGTSQGVPVIACQCKVCRSLDFRDKRLRTSLHIEQEGRHLVIDSGPDFRQQILQNQIPTLDALLFTHEHQDHIAGLDDVRPFNYLQGKATPIYGSQSVIKRLRKSFDYVFAAKKYPGIPQLELHQIKNEPFQLIGLTFQPIQVMHYKLPVFGFRVGDFTYITDANFIAPEELEKVKGTKILVLNALRRTKHISHFTLEEAIEVIEKVQPEKGYLTHISHLMGTHQHVSAELPEHIELAYDGLRLEI